MARPPMPPQSTRITTVRFQQFKALRDYTLHLDRMNILVGPNNSGKSTIIAAFRVLAAALRTARTKTPERLELPLGSKIAYRLPESTLPISLENVHTDYGSGISEVTFSLNDGNSLHLVFDAEGGCFLWPELHGGILRTSAAFRKHFPITLAVVPVLGPVEHREIRRERDTVVAWLSTHRASRHFRSYWYYFPEGFEAFSRLVSTTWPGMEIRPPEVVDAISKELAMFCLEERMTREIYWVGFGFQIWCQLLTHLSRNADASLVVIDEPEVYLHPDIQRQLLGLLREGTPYVLVATHSTEIMGEAEASEIVIVDKHRRQGERLRDIAGVQRAMDAVGSIQNITLTALARSRRVLFVEGETDFRILRRFARRLGKVELAAGAGVIPLASGGFGSWQRITILASGIADALGSSLAIAAIYDRDYFCQEEVDFVRSSLGQHLRFSHVHERKEIENYLLVPGAIDRAIVRAIEGRGAFPKSKNEGPPDTREVLRELTDPLKDDVQSQFIARRVNHLRTSGRDISEITRETLAWFSQKWEQLDSRLAIVPGKEVLGALRQRVKVELGVSLTDARIVEAIHRDEIPRDLVQLIDGLDAFRIAEP